jgi:hypothetical protein
MALFGRSRADAQRAPLEGVVTFFSSHHALRAESVLKKAEHHVRLIPGPREISANCGVALRFDYAAREPVAALLAANGVQIENIHLYPEG